MATTKKDAWSYLPTSNAVSGHIFLMLKRIQRDMRSEMKNDTKCMCFNIKKCASDAVLKSVIKAVTYQSQLQN